MASPSSEQQLWSSLRSRVDDILEDPRRQPISTSCWPSSPSCAVESESRKRLREDSLLLVRGFDSVSSSLAQLTGILGRAAQEARELSRASVTEGGSDHSEPKRLRPPKSSDGGESNEAEEEEEKAAANSSEGDGGSKTEMEAKEDGGHLDRARKIAATMAGKAAKLARELRRLKEEMGFVKERCGLLEEENRRLREGLEDGLRPEEDDLVRLQLEALLAEKSRLANENATLTRENHCLHQLVEYHQLASQELSESYGDEEIQGVCLNFSPFSDGSTRCTDQGVSTPPSKALDSGSNFSATC